MKWFRPTIASLVLMLAAGCTSTASQQADSWVYPPMAVPLQSSVQQQVQIARLTQLLQRPDLSDKVRAKMLYERGSFYDNVGLKDLARLDFDRSLSYYPVQPDLFNLLGVYYTQIGEFDAAYQAFESCLELDPENVYAERNLAVALYYGDRTEMAIEAMKRHYENDPTDPFRAMWLYIVEAKKDPEAAREHLLTRFQDRDEQWGWVLVSILLEQAPDDQTFRAIIEGTKDNTLLAERLTEAYYYMAKRYHLDGDLASALSLYKMAISFNVFEYIEHKYSFVELNRIYNTVRAEQVAAAKAAQANGIAAQQEE
ncbi:lipoprotein NlpI [Vibrio sp.]|uniref:lipoprotein NlpI n=1 Tax=Vibrio sp. TaxID=678 RepID=UPI003D0B2522